DGLLDHRLAPGHRPPVHHHRGDQPDQRQHRDSVEHPAHRALRRARPPPTGSHRPVRSPETAPPRTDSAHPPTVPSVRSATPPPITAPPGANPRGAPPMTSIALRTLDCGLP